MNKDECKLLARKNGNENTIWRWNDSHTKWLELGALIELCRQLPRETNKKESKSSKMKGANPDLSAVRRQPGDIHLVVADGDSRHGHRRDGKGV